MILWKKKHHKILLISKSDNNSQIEIDKPEESKKNNDMI